VGAPVYLDADLPVVDSLSPEFQADPHRSLATALAGGPVARGPFGPVVLGYDLVQTVLRDRRFRNPVGLGLVLQGITSGPVWDRAAKGLLSLEGEEHERLRRLVSAAFRPGAASRLRSTMIEIIDGLVGQVAGSGACDVVADVARPYPIAVICDLLGVPRGDWERFSSWTEDIFKIFGGTVAADTPDIMRSWGELECYLDTMIEQRRSTLTGDLVSELIRVEEAGDRLTHGELKMLVGAVLTGGTDTTRNQLAAGIELFCEHPDQWALLADEPGLAAGAVEEVVRCAPIIFATLREAVVDVELCAVTIPAGTIVVVSTAAANRDPSVYTDPDRFDIRRVGAAPQLTFGGGIHYCLGVHLAKAELAEALALMARRMPDIRASGPSPWKPITGISGPRTLPVEFSPGH